MRSRATVRSLAVALSFLAVGALVGKAPGVLRAQDASPGEAPPASPSPVPMLAAPPLTEPKDPRARKWLREARELVDENLLMPAVDLLMKALAVEGLSPQERAPIQRLLGTSFLTMEEWDLAIIHLSRYVTTHPADLEVVTRLAGAYTRKSRFDEALDLYESLKPLDPESAMSGMISVYRQEGVARMDQDRPDQAAEAYEACLGLDPVEATCLAGAVEALEELEERQAKSARHIDRLKTLFRLYALGWTRNLGPRLKDAFRRAGSPAHLGRRVKVILEALPAEDREPVGDGETGPTPDDD